MVVEGDLLHGLISSRGITGLAPAEFADEEQAGHPSHPMGPVKGSLLYEVQCSTTVWSVTLVREWQPRQKSVTTVLYQESRAHNIKPTCNANPMLMPPILREANTCEIRALRVTTGLSDACLMLMR